MKRLKSTRWQNLCSFTAMLPRSLSPHLALSLALVSSACADVFFVPDTTGDVVRRVNAVGNPSTLIGSGLMDPAQVAIDAAGDFFVADTGSGKVLRFPAAGGAPVQVGDSVPGVNSLAFSPSGVLHVSCGPDRTIRKLNGNGSAFTVLATLNSGTPRSIAFDPSPNANGELYVADQPGNRIVIVTANGTVQGFTPTNGNIPLSAPYALAFDSAAKLYFTDAKDGGRIGTLNGNGKNASAIVENLGDVRGLVFDRGDIAHYVTGGGELRKVVGTETVLVEDGLGSPELLASRSAGITPIAFSGGKVDAPLTEVTVANVGTPAIGGGSVAFKLNLAAGTNVTTANNLALFRADEEGNLQMLARKSFQAPNETTPVMATFGDPILNNDGRVAFIGTLKPNIGSVTAADSLRIFSDFDGNALRSILKRGDQATGPNLDPLVKFASFKQMVLPEGVGPAIIATISGPGVNTGNNLGVWASDAAGAFSLVVRKGDKIMAGGKERKLTTFTLFKGTAMSLGQARHFGDTQKFTVLAKCSDGFPVILRAQAGMAPVVVAEKGGDAVDAAKLASFTSPAMAEDGFFAHKAILAAPVTAATAQVIIGNDGARSKIARAGDSAGGVTGGVFASLGDPVVSTNGNVAFFGKLKPNVGDVTTATAAGLWQDLGSGPTVAVRQGQTPVGVNGATRFTAFKQFILPPVGGVIFTATIAGTGITTANNLGIWANDGDGASELLLRKNDKVMINGKERTVTSFKVFTAGVGVTGQSRQFDDNGSVVCQVGCSDGTKAILKLTLP